jgi:hypothetical protein
MYLILTFLFVACVSSYYSFRLARIRRFTVKTIGFPVLRFRISYRPFDNGSYAYARHIGFEVSSRLDASNYFRICVTLYFDKATNGKNLWSDTFPYLNRYGKAILTNTSAVYIGRLQLCTFIQSDLFQRTIADLARKRNALDYPDNN